MTTATLVTAVTTMGAVGLPEGVSVGMVAAVLVPAAVVTFLLRALPFSLLKLLQNSPLIEFLGLLMPVGVMTVLVIYTLVGKAGQPGQLAAALGALICTLALQGWKRPPISPFWPARRCTCW